MTISNFFTVYPLLVFFGWIECEYTQQQIIACSATQQNRLFDKFWTHKVYTPTNQIKISVDQFFDTAVSVYVDGDLSASDAVAVIEGWSNTGLVDKDGATNLIIDLSTPLATREQSSGVFDSSKADMNYSFVASAQIGAPPYVGRKDVSLGASFARLQLKPGLTHNPLASMGTEFSRFITHLAITNFLASFTDNYASVRRASKEFASYLPEECRKIK